MATSILIVLTGSLGDIARALCLPAHLKKHLPGSRISWLVEAKWEPLLSGHAYIDRTVTFQRAWRVDTVTNVLRQLKSDNYDIALDLQRIFKSGLLSKASGAKRRIGFHPRNAKEMNWIFNNEHIGYQADNLSKLQHYLKFVEHLGLQATVKLDFGLKSPLPAPDIVNSIRSPYIAVVTGSSWPSKDWHLHGYSELISEILKTERHRVVLLGDRSHTILARQLSEGLRSANLIDLVGRTTLMELVGVLAHARAAIGPDTGSGHLAAAVGTPYVTLIGPTAAERIAPYGNEHLVVTGEAPCSPCGRKECPQPQYDCMGGISATRVFEKLDVALNQRNKV